MELLIAILLTALVVSLLLLYFTGIYHASASIGHVIDKRESATMVSDIVYGQLTRVKEIQEVTPHRLRFIDSDYQEVDIHSNDGSIEINNTHLPLSQSCGLNFQLTDRTLSATIQLGETTAAPSIVSLKKRVISNEK